MASPRQLAYRDRFVWELEQTVSSIFDDCDGLSNQYVFPDMTTRVPFVMYLSQEQFTQLYSAVLTGADLTYPNKSHDIEYLFLQTVNCTMSELCQAIADCIINSGTTQNALNIYLTLMGLTGGTGNPWGAPEAELIGAQLLPEGYVCTNDLAFGMSLAVVDAINEAVTEVLQAIEVLTNPLEIAAEVGDNFPGVGALATVADVTNWIQDTAKEQYDLAWSTTIRDELACDLWCEFKASCYLSFDSIWDVYLAAADVTPPVSLYLEDWLAWLILLPLTVPKATVAAVSLLGLLAMRYGGKFGDFQLGIRSMETVIALNADASSSDWDLLCECTGTWCVEFDFTVDDGGWNVIDYGGQFTGTAGQYVAGVGFEATDLVDVPPGGRVTRLAAIEPSISETVITRILMTYDYEFDTGQSGPTQPSFVQLRLGAGGWTIMNSANPDTTGFAKELEWTGNMAADQIQCRITPSYTHKPPPAGGSGTIFAMRVEGEGSNPFVGYECP